MKHTIEVVRWRSVAHDPRTDKMLRRVCWKLNEFTPSFGFSGDVCEPSQGFWSQTPVERSHFLSVHHETSLAGRYETRLVGGVVFFSLEKATACQSVLY